MSTVPPSNIEAEVSLLGAILLNPEIADEVFDYIRDRDFSDQRYQTIYRVLARMYQDEKALDVLVLRDELKDAGLFERVGGADIIADLQNRVPSSANFPEYMRILHNKGVIRELMKTAQEIIDNSCSESPNADDLLDLAEHKVFSIGEDGTRQLGAMIGDLLDPLLEIMSEGKSHSGLYTGYDGLDNYTNGFGSGQMIIIAGRPGIGKTTFALNIVERVAVRDEKPVAVFTLEMDASQITQNILLMHSKVNADSFNRGRLTKDDHARMVMGIDRLRNVPIIIDDTPEPSIMSIRSRARRLKRRHDLQLIVIDYLQLMQPGNVRETGRSIGSRENEISFISRNIKLLAKDLGIPIIAISQLNRDVDNRTEKKPRLSDLRESGAIEQDADMVILMSRRDYYGDNQDSVIADIDLAKNRHGPTGEFQLVYDKKKFYFENSSQRSEEHG